MDEEGMGGQSNDRMLRNMEFIVEQQAEFAAGMQRLRELQERAEEKWERRWESVERRWERTEEGIRALLAVAEIHEREIGALKEAQDRTDRQMAETDERLNALINVVERKISEDRNGG
jgi:chromosome segregation ATPase